MSDKSLEAVLAAFDKTRLGHPDDPDDPIDPLESDGAENISPNHEVRPSTASKSTAALPRAFGQAKSPARPQSRPENVANSPGGSIEHKLKIEEMIKSVHEDKWSLSSFLKTEALRKKLEDEDDASYVIVGRGGAIDPAEKDAEDFELLTLDPIPSDDDLMHLALRDLRKAKEEDCDDGVLIDERELVIPTEKSLTLEDELKANYPLLHAVDKTRILKDVKAQINVEGPIGMINGFTLGSLTGYPKDEEVINAAWGEAVFLLSFLARNLECKFKRYVLYPRGNRSYIEDLKERPTRLTLYLLDKPRPMAELVHDSALMAFLNCMKQLEEHVKQRHASFEPMYAISGNQILYDRWERKAYLIIKRGNVESLWTVALKYMLSDLKQFLYIFMREHCDRLRNQSS